MIIKQAQHFLTDEGKVFFVEWVKRLQWISKKYSGFDKVVPMRSGEYLDEIHLLLVFSDDSACQRWVSGSEHSEVLEQLKPYSVKPWQAKTYVDLE